MPSRAVSQLLWSDKDREVWFSLLENHEEVFRFGLHQLRNCFIRQRRRPRFGVNVLTNPIVRLLFVAPLYNRQRATTGP
jgi:hypothetical protein